MRFFNLFQHLLPRGKAWSIIVDKPLRRLFDGLSVAAREVVKFVDLAYLDVFPDTTRKLDDWERQFNLPNPGLTDQVRRDRLTARWRARGGQSRLYIQETLQAAGFPVWVHEWFSPSDQAYRLGNTSARAGNILVQLGNTRGGTVSTRNPQLYVRSDGTVIDYEFELGTTLAELGESDMELGAVDNQVGYLLVNKIFNNAGNRVEYAVPSDRTEWPYVMYVGGFTFPNSVTIDPLRREEFEDLLLSIAPGHLWLGVIVVYGAQT